MAPFHLQSVILTDILVATNEISKKVFGLPTGGKVPATTVAKLHLNIRAPANRVDIVPTLETTLLSGRKFADVGYIAVYDANEVNLYHGKISTARLSMPKIKSLAHPTKTCSYQQRH